MSVALASSEEFFASTFAPVSYGSTGSDHVFLLERNVASSNVRADESFVSLTSVPGLTVVERTRGVCFVFFVFAVPSAVSFPGKWETGSGVP